MRETLDGGEVVALVRDGERQAGFSAAAVDEDRAGTALAVIAALLRSREPEVLAQEVEQGDAGVEEDFLPRPFRRGPHGRWHGHGLSRLWDWAFAATPVTLGMELTIFLYLPDGQDPLFVMETKVAWAAQDIGSESRSSR